MKKFIKQVIGRDERPLLWCRLHWIYILEGCVWFSALLGLGAGMDHVFWHYMAPVFKFYASGFYQEIGAPVLSLPLGGFGAVILVLHVLKVLTSDIVLTNQRIIYKKGFIFVEVKEIDLMEIHAEEVHHGLLGRFLDYGEIKFDSRFIGDIRLPAVRHPYVLTKAMHSARAKLPDPLEGFSPQPELRRSH